MNIFNGIYLLLWKNLKLKLRHPLVLLMEIGIPCLFSAILAIVRIVITFDSIDKPTIFPMLPIDYVENIQGKSKSILYTPPNPFTDSVMNNLKNLSMKTIGNSSTIQLIPLDNEKLLVDHYIQESSETILCGIIFESISEKTRKFNVKIRFPFVPKLKTDFSVKKIEDLTWQTARLFPMFQKPGPRNRELNEGGPPSYMKEGFLFVQHQLNRAIGIKLNSSIMNRLENIEMNVQRFPYPPYDNDQFLFALQFFFPLILMLSFIYPSVNLTKNIVLEKEQRLTEAMRMMGLRDWLHWTSWFVNSLFWNLISVIIITILLCVHLKPNIAIIGESNPILIFLFFSFYTVSSIMFCFMLSTLFSRANIAGVIAGALYFATFLPYFQVSMNYSELNLWIKLGISSVFNTNMALGCMIISMWETEHVGLQWWNLFESASPDDNLTFFHILMMFAVDAVLYLLVALYIQNVFPGEFGIPKSWYFFLQPSYWCKPNSTIIKPHNGPIELDLIKSNGTHADETVIRIEDLSKSYDRGKTYAVNHLNMKIEPNEITALLGHNGAGKTTLMSILCGLIPPSSGAVYVGQHNLIRDIDLIRKDLGICPQFDVLFNHLTVEEHLWFYCKLKGINANKIKSEIDKMISLLDLEPKRRNLSNTLSGGMKRKLSVGIALVGGSKFVLLDEATSGMDVLARRFIWDLLLKEKKNRVILLSTHFMEEADVLGDKIAIIDHGTLKCFDTPMALKKEYGMGYLLTFSTKEELVNGRLLHDLIRSHVNQAKLLTSVGTEITYSLPQSETSKFELLFQTIEQNMEKLGVVNYGISVTTIEEVFLRVGDFAKQGADQFNQLNQQEVKKNGIEHNSILENMRPNALKLNTGIVHQIQIYWSLLAKKMLFFVRNPFLIFAQFPLPSILLTVSILTDRGNMDKAISSPALSLSLKPYKNVHMSIFRDQSEISQQISGLYSNYVHSSSEGTYIKLDENKYNQRVENQSLNNLVNFSIKHTPEYNLYYMAAARIESGENDSLTLTALFNNQAYHTSSLSMMLLDTALMRYLLNDNSFEINIWNEPMPRKKIDLLNSRELDSTIQVQLSNSLLFSTCFLLASFIILLVKERATNFRHIQQISGLRLFQYWISNFILDYSVFIISSFIMAMVIYFFKVDAFQTLSQLSYLALTFASTGLAALPFIYICSAIFGDPSTAYVRVSLYMLIAGTTSFLMVLILKIPDFDLLTLSSTLDTIFSILLPVYTMAISIFWIFENYKAQEFCLGNITIINTTTPVQMFCKDNNWKIFPMVRACCKDICGDHCLEFEENYLSWNKPGIGQYLIAFLCQAVIFWVLLTIIEYDRINFKAMFTCFQRKVNVPKDSQVDDDDDVRAEEDRIRRRSFFTLNKTDSMVVQNLTKKYGNFTAVNDISFGVKRGECFGILGVNGAGKTTTFKMITGVEKITSGNIIINGTNIKNNMNKIFKQIGYCPQFNGLLDQLTGRETLRIVSRIRGIDESSIDGNVDSLSKLLYFNEHIDKPVSSYSGGTKRKLSFAMSTIGNPLIIFLDEPTTGVDPVSRRCLWNAIELVRSAGSSIALTSHSMEECEALCNRLFIMVNAKISCIGSALHLKQKYGSGYVIQIKFDSYCDEKSRARLDHFIINRWPSCTLESEHNNLFTYRVNTNDIHLSSMFGDIERIKQEYAIEDYSICQTSLERIFLSFARRQQITV